MRILTAVLASFVFAIAGFDSVAQEKAAEKAADKQSKKAAGQPDKKAPDKLVFKSKQGDVPFNHAQHAKDAKNDCTVCHDKLWPQSSTAPLNYKAGVHKIAEAKHTSCGFCHHAGGSSFASKDNCNKCHVKAAKKS